jgi:signal transduction histidine kinase
VNRPAVTASLAILLVFASGCGGPSRRIELTEAELRLGRSAQLPVGEAGWERVRLPDRWPLERRRIAVEGWYRLRVARPADPAEPWALFVPRIYPNGAFFVNGVAVGAGGRMQPPISRNSFRPLCFAIPQSAWRAGDSWIQVHFVGTPSSLGRFEPIFVGPAEELLADSEVMRFFHVTLPQLSALLCLVLAAALAVTPPIRLGGQLWFAGGLVCIALTTLSAFLPDARLPNRAVEWIVGSALPWAGLCFAIGVRRRWGLRLPAERAWLALYVLAALAFAVVPALQVGRVWVPWMAATVVLSALMVARLLQDAWHNRARWLAGAALVAAAAGLFDLVLSALGANAVQGALAALVPALFVLGFGGSLLVTLVAALRESDALNRTLDARVADREHDLAVSYEQLRGAERDRALAEERARLMRDVHDGTGGKLVTALSLLRGGRAAPAELEETLADALDDLNLTIHSIRPGASDLPGVLGLLRPRLDRQTRQHGLHLDWAISDAGEGRDLSPERVMHVIRIVQESVANVLRHAGAARLRIASGGGGDAEPAWFEIADDGRGGAAPRAGGRGLANLRQRAELLGGRLELRSDEAGTRVRVILENASASPAA